MCHWQRVLQDMLDVIDVEGKREPGTYPQNQGGFDLIWANGPVQQFEKPTSLPTLLGCYNPRDQNQLRSRACRHQCAAALQEDAQ